MPGGGFTFLSQWSCPPRREADGRRAHGCSYSTVGATCLPPQGPSQTSRPGETLAPRTWQSSCSRALKRVIHVQLHAVKVVGNRMPIPALSYPIREGHEGNSRVAGTDQLSHVAGLCNEGRFYRISDTAEPPQSTEGRERGPEEAGLGASLSFKGASKTVPRLITGGQHGAPCSAEMAPGPPLPLASLTSLPCSLSHGKWLDSFSPVLSTDVSHSRPQVAGLSLAASAGRPWLGWAPEMANLSAHDGLEQVCSSPGEAWQSWECLPCHGGGQPRGDQQAE